MKYYVKLAVVAVGSITGLGILGSAESIMIGGRIVRVEQGPFILAKLLYDPPWWVVPGALLVGAAVVARAYQGYRDAGIDEQVKKEMSEQVLIVIVVSVITLGLVYLDVLPYVADVGIAGVGGFLIARFLSKFIIY